MKDKLKYKYCRICGTNVSSSSFFCPNCGKELLREKKVDEKNQTAPQKTHHTTSPHSSSVSTNTSHISSTETESINLNSKDNTKEKNKLDETIENKEENNLKEKNKFQKTTKNKHEKNKLQKTTKNKQENKSNEKNNEMIYKKSEGIAVLFSLLIIGFGQVYNGQILKGILFLIIGYSLLSLIWPLGIIFYLYNLYDAYKTAIYINDHNGNYFYNENLINGN